MAIHATERHLLFGILALQNGLIDQANLIAAFQDWTQDKSRPLAQILVDRGALDEADRLMLDPLLRRHLQKHGDDAERSLAAVPRLEAITAGLRRLADPMFDGTLDRLPVGDSGQATIPPGASQTADWGVGEATGDGRFRVVRPLAKGGIGLVSVAVDGELHREVALKEIRPEQADDPRSRARFLLEAEVTGRLEHPGIVPVYGLGTDAQGRPFYAMRLVRGDSLQEAIDRFHRDDQNARREPGERALALRGLLGRFVDVCNAVAYAHARGVIHRDLKPSNILLGPYGETLVVDWGLAKVVGRDEPEPGGPAAEVTLQPTSGSGSSETVPGSVIGTPAYMSPEQAEGRLGDIGPSSDVYSLGATLFSLLTGQPPVADREVVEVLRKVQRGDLRPARQVNPRVPRALEAVVGKAMALRPTGRYGSARSLAADIDHWLAGEPVSAWHEPWTLRARRWIRRHQATATGVAAAVVVAVAGLMAVSIVQAEANRGLRVSNTRLTDSLTREASTSAALRAANVRERASREQAQRRFGLARQAIEQYYTGASEDVLLKEPELEALRKKLLGTSLAFYKRLQAELEGSDDPATGSELAAAYLRVGEITAQVGQTGEALEAYERARAIRAALVQADPSADGPRRELSRSLESSGTLLVRISGRTIEGLQRLESALALRQALAAGPRRGRRPAGDRPDPPRDRKRSPGRGPWVRGTAFPRAGPRRRRAARGRSTRRRRCPAGISQDLPRARLQSSDHGTAGHVDPVDGASVGTPGTARGRAPRRRRLPREPGAYPRFRRSDPSQHETSRRVAAVQEARPGGLPEAGGRLPHAHRLSIRGRSRSSFHRGVPQRSRPHGGSPEGAGTGCGAPRAGGG